MRWFHRERRKHLAATFHAVALGTLAVVGFADLQRGVYRGFAQALVLFLALEFAALALIPPADDDERDGNATYARRRLPGAR